jgi:hypothetical protein
LTPDHPRRDATAARACAAELFALTEYRAVFYSDVDVDLFLHTAGQPPPAVPRSAAFDMFAHGWLRGYEAFLRSGTHLT